MPHPQEQSHDRSIARAAGDGAPLQSFIASLAGEPAHTVAIPTDKPAVRALKQASAIPTN